MAENTYDNNDQGRQDQAQSIARTASPPLTTTPNQQPVGQTQGQTNQEMSDAEALKQVSPTVTMGQVAATQQQYVNGPKYPEENQAGKKIQKIQLPPGADVDANIEEAKHMSWIDFVKHVKSGGEWDYKSKFRHIKPNPYEDAGNFNFGATGRAVGFTEEILKMGAGAYQIFEGHSHSDWGGPIWQDNKEFSNYLDKGLYLGARTQGLGSLLAYLSAKYQGVITNINHGDEPKDQNNIGLGVRYHDQYQQTLDTNDKQK